MAIEKLSGRVVYENRWMRVREDQVRFAGGQEGIYGVVEKPDFALIIPRHDDGRFQLVEQFRYTVGDRFWEFPQGAWEDASGVDPTELARGELREETGFEAGKMRHLAHLYEAYGFCDQGLHVFLAEDLRPGPPQREMTEQDMRTGVFSLDEMREMIRAGTIKDGPTVAALGLLLLEG